MLFKNIPIQKKLVRIISLISGIVLVITSVTFFIYEFYSFRKTSIEKLSTIGAIISTNSTAALAFDNANDAKEILAALKAETHIVAAALYDKDGNLFSQYSSGSGSPVFPARPGSEGYRFEDAHLQGFHPVVQDTRQLGTLYLKSDLGAMYERMQLYSIIVVLVIALSFLLVYILSRILQKSVSVPILALAETAKVVSNKSDYSLRAVKQGEDELGSLTDAFNHMLAQIEEQTTRQQLAEKEKEHALQKLSESEELFRSMIEQLPNPVIRYSPDGTFTYANAAWETMWEDKRENAIGYNIRNDRQMISSGLSEYVEQAFAGKVALSDPYLYDPALIGKKGRPRWIQMLLYPLKDADNKILEVILILLDITANKEAEKIVKESEEKFRSMIERISDAFITIDKDWVYTYVNKKAAELSGKPAGYLVGKNVWEVFPEGIGQPFYNELQKAMKTQQPAHLEMYYPPANKWYEDYIYPTPESVSVYYHEITQKKRDEIALRESEERYKQLNEELRNLSAHLQSIREEERMNIAREIHDQLGQQLTVMKMDVSWLKKKLVTTDNKAKEKLEGLDNMLDDTVKIVRRIASDLRPGLLDDLGLLAAVEWQLEDFGKRSGIAVQVNCLKEEPALPDAVKIGLFRIIQESLTNVARYAQAKNLSVQMKYQNDDLVLTIRDDGIGFDKTKIASKKTLGILGMRERTTMMGGSYEIISEPGEGTTVIVKVPVEQALH